jgi:hypothetical protein
VDPGVTEYSPSAAHLTKYLIQLEYVFLKFMVCVLGTDINHWFYSDKIMKSHLCSKVIMERKKFYIKNITKRNETTFREAWLAESRALADKIRKNHGDQMIDVDRIIELDKQEFEDRFSNWLNE